MTKVISAAEYRALFGAHKHVSAVTRATTQPVVLARARQTNRSAAMNRNEARYSQFLDAEKKSGHILDWKWSPLKFRLGNDWKTTLTPDFMVITLDGTIELVDCKGRKGDSFWVEEDAMIKLKVAAAQYSWFRWVIVWQAKDGTWRRHELR